MSSEHRNRTNKAQAIAAALWAAGVHSPADVADLTEVSWRLAARTGWHLAVADSRGRTEWTDASPATRRMVAQLIEGQAHAEAVEADGLVAHEVDDVFAQIAAGSSLPRPAADADGPPARVQPMSWEDAEAIDYEYARRDAERDAAEVAAAVARHPAASHTLNCLAGFTRPCSC